MVTTIWFRFDLIRFQTDFSVCGKNFPAYLCSNIIMRLKKIQQNQQIFHHREEFSNINDTFKRLIGILANWHISTDNRYFDEDSTLQSSSKYLVEMLCITMMPMLRLSVSFVLLNSSDFFFFSSNPSKVEIFWSEISLLQIEENSLAGKKKIIIAVWETGASRHPGGLIEGLKQLPLTWETSLSNS